MMAIDRAVDRTMTVDGLNERSNIKSHRVIEHNNCAYRRSLLRETCVSSGISKDQERETCEVYGDHAPASDEASFCWKKHQYAAPPSFLSSAPVGPNSPLIKELSSTNFKSWLTRSQTCVGDLNFFDIGLQVSSKEISCQRKQNLLSFYHTCSRSKFYDYDPHKCLESNDLGADRNLWAAFNEVTHNLTHPSIDCYYDAGLDDVADSGVFFNCPLEKSSSNGRTRIRRSSLSETHSSRFSSSLHFCSATNQSGFPETRCTIPHHNLLQAVKFDSKDRPSAHSEVHENCDASKVLLSCKFDAQASTCKLQTPHKSSSEAGSLCEESVSQQLLPSQRPCQFLELPSSISQARLSPLPAADTIAAAAVGFSPQSLDYWKMMPCSGKKFKVFYSLVSQAWLTALVLLSGVFVPGAWCSQYGDAEHITAILGDAVVLNCPVSQPDTPYIIQWKRQHHKIPIYIWYDGYDPHVEEAYKGRASRVNQDTTLGLASLNLTAVKEDDQGWYECKVFYLDRTGATDNGTWIHLDVHAPPRFTTTPDDVTYVNIGDSIILNCEAEGTPKPEIFWFRDDDPVTPSESVGIFNDGTELRINKIRDQDIGDYLCVARNAEGRVHHEAKVVIAGGAVIITPPHNMTRQEGEKAEFPCEAKALPGNVTVSWKREDVPINRLSWLDTRSILRHDGTLVINPTSADDGGFFTCEVSNGIGTPQRAVAYLNVEYPARVTYTPTVQYLPFRQQGIVKCHIKANPEVQFVTWIKDKRLFEPDNEEGVVKLKNGSLLFTKVNQSYQGRYSCTPYNKHTTAGSSGDMEVLVREPPEFAPRPQPQYHGQLGEEVTLVCGGSGSPTPSVTWRRRDGLNLPRDRTEIHGGNLTIKSLLKSDHAFYECEVKNEILVIVASTQVLVENTTPHPPYNITTKTSSFSVELSWLPGYPGGRDWEQKYTIWYRTLGSTTWSQVEVQPPGSTAVTIHNLTPGSTYEFQVQGKNELGDGMFSDIITATTQEYDHWQMVVYPTDSSGTTYFPTIVNPKGPQPPPPRNVTITPNGGGYTISWLPPLGSVPITSYDIEHKTGDSNWKKLNKREIVNVTSYHVDKLTPGKTHRFKVFAKTLTSFQVSEEVSVTLEELDKKKAVTAAVVGGMLLCIVAIILSVFTVKICNKRKRKKQEKELQSHIFYDTAYNMVACRVSETRNGGYRGSAVPLKNPAAESVVFVARTGCCSPRCSRAAQDLLHVTPDFV
ncbi:protein turtle [Hyalella azteca]|uniref:Protein turtle n=1 Tax=Hyalella azteca TaxID=294128 RepID=A0A979FXP5_HYAAZ|nr:protein turtle [Hyalella azteca]